MDETVDRFWSHDTGGFRFAADDHEAMLIRHRDGYDGAMPSGNSIAMWNLLRLGRLVGRADLEERASQVSEAFGRDLRRAPSGHAHMVAALAAAGAPSLEVVIVGTPGAPDTEALLTVARQNAAPGSAIVLIPDGSRGEHVRRLVAYAAAHSTIDNRATAYVCRDFVCRLPTTDPSHLATLLTEETASRSR